MAEIRDQAPILSQSLEQTLSLAAAIEPDCFISDILAVQNAEDRARKALLF
ncbi:hypothetical protein ACFX5Q_14860 [Mesorhizobium sp. IMUNJ 23033]